MFPMHNYDRSAIRYIAIVLTRPAFYNPRMHHTNIIKTGDDRCCIVAV